jgi:hypothetical protein
VRLGPLPAGHPPPKPPPGLGRARRADKDLHRPARQDPHDRALPLRGDYDRAQRVIAEIDAAAPPPSKDSA